MTMKVERVGLDEVKDRLQQHTATAQQHTTAHSAVKRKRAAAAADEDDEGEGEEADHDGEVGEEERKERGGEEERKEEKVLGTHLSRTEEQLEEEALMAQMGFKFRGFAAGKGT